MKIIIKYCQFSLFIFMIFIVQIAYSQENYQPGYVINLEGDTLKGVIDNEFWTNNPTKISFKSNKNVRKIIYEPKDILGFGVIDKSFVSATFDIEISTRIINKLGIDTDLNLEKTFGFLKIIIEGPKSLYYFQDDSERENFYIFQDGKYELLKHKKYKKVYHYTGGSRSFLKHTKTYLRQLTDYLSDCTNVNEQIPGTAYKLESIMNLYKYYYDCKGVEIDFQEKKRKIRNDIGVVLGTSITMLNFKGSSHSYLVNSTYPASLQFSAAIYYNMVLPSKNGKWSLYNELLYNSYLTDSNVTEIRSENETAVTQSEIGASYIKWNGMIRDRILNFKEFQVFLNAGISYGLKISETNFRSTESTFYNSVNLTEEIAIMNSRQAEFGLLIGGGVALKNLSFQLRFEKGNGISKKLSLKSNTNRIYLLAGYSF